MALLRFRNDPEGITLSHDRVILRLPTLEDYDAWADLRARSRKELEPFEPRWARDELSYSSYKHRLKCYVQDRKNEVGYAFFLFDPKGGHMVGGLTLSNIRRGAIQSASVGYWTGTPYHRQGYMFAALRRVRSFVFHDLGLNRLEAACLLNNDASRALLEKAGFQQEGVARGYYRIGGEWRDHHLYAILARDLV